MSRDIKAGGAYVELLLKSQSFVAGLKSASSRLKTFGDSAKRIGSLGFLGGGGGGFGTLFAGAGAAAALAYPIKLAANLEVAEAQFRSLTGSAEKAAMIIAGIEEFSSTSLINVDELQRVSQLLLGYGLAAEKVIPSVKALAEISRGNAERFSLLALAFGQTTAKTRLYAAEVRQFVESGFNPLQQIAATTGETMQEVSKRLEAGGISADELSAALQGAVGPGGRFNGLLATMGKTATGAFSRLLTGLKLAIRPLGQELLPAIRGVVEKANEWTPAFAKIVKENAKIATVVGVAVVSFVGAAAAVTSFGIAVQVAAFGLAGVAAAFGLLLNPIGLTTAALAGLATWFATSTEWGRQMVTALAGWFGQLKDIAVEAFGGIADALAAGDIALAWKVAALGIQASWLQATDGLRKAWSEFKDMFMRTTIEMVFSAQSYWSTFANALRSTWASLVNDSKSIGEEIGHWLTRSSDPATAADQDAAHENAKSRIFLEGEAEQERIKQARDAELAAIEAARAAAQEGQSATTNAERERIDRDLQQAKKDLAVAREQARQAREGGALNIAGAPKFDPANFEMNGASLKNQILGSFSLAQLQAQAGSGDPVTRMADFFRTWTKEQRQEYRTFLREWREANKLG